MNEREKKDTNTFYICNTCTYTSLMCSNAHVYLLDKKTEAKEQGKETKCKDIIKTATTQQQTHTHIFVGTRGGGSFFFLFFLFFLGTIYHHFCLVLGVVFGLWSYVLD